ncbi:MAG: gamma carbonic anhydrase family protein [Candidatus Omnitrophota bacterium]|jgi:carbonic anhydrase/acetyltransferase-like protein (isoleucine patch superfamily)|nr:MAG: gamma carbonic anhydrase family protein [Candidatus Omnitrophota bacterium]
MQIQNSFHISLPENAYGGGLVLPYLQKFPIIGEDVFLAPNASVIGEVTLGPQVSVWFGTVIRADIAPISVGDGSNIQDNSVLHVGTNEPCRVGINVVVGHNAILHGCTVENECMIGMGAIILNRAVIGKGCVVGAGALVTEDTIIPPYSLVLGSPGKVKRVLREDERSKYCGYASKYVDVAENYRRVFVP